MSAESALSAAFRLIDVLHNGKKELLDEASLVKKTVVIALLLLAGIVTATWLTMFVLGRPITWENHTDFMRPGHHSFGLNRNSWGFTLTDEVDPETSHSFNALGFRVSVLQMYEHKVAGTTSVVAPRVILFDASYRTSIILLLLYPALVEFRKRVQNSRIKRQEAAGEGRFCRCGYDLTGNVSGVCPECGTATISID